MPRGEKFNLEALCPDLGRPAPKLKSPALVPDGLDDWVKDPAGWWLSKDVTVRPDIGPGSWPVTFTCAGEEITKNLLVGLEADAEVYAAIGIQDDVILPGQEVLVIASCQRADFTGSPVTSSVLKAEDLVRRKGEAANSPVSALGVIDKDARPGTYEISFVCVDREVTGTFTVTAPEQEPAAQVPVKPHGAPETGSLSPSGDRPVGLAVGMGAVLLGAGGLGAAALARRRRA